MNIARAKTELQSSAISSLVRVSIRDRVSPAVVGVAAYTCLVIGRIPDFFPSARLSLIAAGLAVGLALLLPKRPRLLQGPEVRAVIAIVAIALISIPFSVWPGESFNFVINGHSKTVIFFFLLVYCVRSLREFRVVVWGLIWAIAALQVMSFFFNVSPDGRLVVTNTYDKNDIAFVMVCALPLMVVMSYVGARSVRLISVSIVALTVPVIILSESRGGFIGFLVVGILLLFRLSSRRSVSHLLLVIGAILLFTVFTPESYWARISTIWGGITPGGESSDYDTSGLRGARWDIWMNGLKLLIERPFLGVGAGAFEVAEGLSHGGIGKWQAPHNSFIEVGAELGVGGLLLLLFLIFRAIQNCRSVVRLGRHDPQFEQCVWLAHGLEISLYGFIVAGFALSHGYSQILYFLLAMSIVLKRLTMPVARPETGPTEIPSR